MKLCKLCFFVHYPDVVHHLFNFHLGTTLAIYLRLYIKAGGIMGKGEESKKRLEPNRVYRRKDLIRHAGAFDRHLVWLLADGTLVRVGHGLYYYPQQSVFEAVPLEDKIVVRTFFKTDQFLLVSPGSYDALQVGTAQLHSLPVVYNHRIQGRVELEGRWFFFRKVPHFPLHTTAAFLLVDLVNHLDTLAEDREQVLEDVMARARTMDVHRLRGTVDEYGNMETRRLFAGVLE